LDIIKISNLNFKYDDVDIFENFNFNIEKNTFVSIIGSNGSGKSTLIKILCGLLSYEGYINVDNMYLNKENIKKIRTKIGYINDHIDNQFLGETVLDNLVYNIENLCYSKEEIKKQLEKITKIFKLQKLLNKQPNELTNSQKQVVNIASNLIHEPKIILIDEGLHQLNIEDKNLIFNILNKLKKEKKMTIILVTHNIEDTITSDKVVVLDKGKIILENSPIAVFEQEKKLKQIGINPPFIIKLSNKLKDNNLISEITCSKEKLVDMLWN